MKCGHFVPGFLPTIAPTGFYRKTGVGTPMHTPGHYGAALCLYAPIGFVVAIVHTIELAVVGAVVAAVLSPLPDIDLKLPFVAHRGVTHTIHFVVLVGLSMGVTGGVVATRTDTIEPLALAGFGLLIGVVSIGSHLLADALTPMGIDPFRTGTRYTLSLTRAANPIANLVLLMLGVIAIVAAGWGLHLFGAL